MRDREQREERYFWTQCLPDRYWGRSFKNIAGIHDIPGLLRPAPLLRVQRTEHVSKLMITRNTVCVYAWRRESAKSVQDSCSVWIVTHFAARKWTWRSICRERRRMTVNLFWHEINLYDGMNLRSICIYLDSWVCQTCHSKFGTEKSSQVYEPYEFQIDLWTVPIDQNELSIW